ncbi:hypothetical protein JYB87_11950 [Shewanella avicenniae]|uniref:Uncharacterized protein n=1 Tax=Shewanella avicenniae TaxID=2814294 RepID=A0ABX7QM00_9GAMM|nr:hypothetical protein [Shewanella avicenniae]QSX32478.1 hypothetical protein JYB87_11950 [Shewanella avicenniae]
MDNQHRYINGYRDLTSEEIDLINEIKMKGRELNILAEQLKEKLTIDNQLKATAASRAKKDSEQYHEFERFKRAEPFKWAEMGKASIQTGIMALVRSIAQPED